MVSALSAYMHSALKLVIDIWVYYKTFFSIIVDLKINLYVYWSNWSHTLPGNFHAQVIEFIL